MHDAIICARCWIVWTCDGSRAVKRRTAPPLVFSAVTLAWFIIGPPPAIRPLLSMHGHIGAAVWPAGGAGAPCAAATPPSDSTPSIIASATFRIVPS